MRRRHVLHLLGLDFPLALAHASRPAFTAQTTTIPAKSKTLRVNGVRLHYLEWGDERARPIVLLHPAPLNARVWDHLGPILASRFHVVAPDARGFGDSAWSDAYDGDVFLDDLHALIAALSLKQPALCGNSMGGTLAYMYAGLHPDLVERLITVDTGPGEPPAVSPNGAQPARLAGPPPQPPGPFKSVEDAAASIPPVMGAAFAKAMIDYNLKRTDHGGWAWKHDHARVMAAGARSATDPRRWPLWNAVQCPTLVLRGERSPALSQAVAERMVAGRQNAVLEVVPGAGHFIPLEAPTLFATAVLRWLGA